MSSTKERATKNLITDYYKFRIMGRFIIKFVRLILKYGRFGLFCVVIQLDGNSKYIEYTYNLRRSLLWI